MNASTPPVASPPLRRLRLWLAAPTTALLLPLATMYGPMVAPHALTVVAPLICKDETGAARTILVGGRSREARADRWELECQDGAGRVAEPPGPRAMTGALLCFGGALIATMTAAVGAFALVERRLRGGAS